MSNNFESWVVMDVAVSGMCVYYVAVIVYVYYGVGLHTVLILQYTTAGKAVLILKKHQILFETRFRKPLDLFTGIFLNLDRWTKKHSSINWLIPFSLS